MSNVFSKASTVKTTAVSREKYCCPQGGFSGGISVSASTGLLPNRSGCFARVSRKPGGILTVITLTVMLIGANSANASEADQYDLGSSFSISSDEYSIGSNDVSINDITIQEDGAVVWPSSKPRLRNSVKFSSERNPVNPDVLGTRNRKVKSFKPVSNSIACRHCDYVK